MKNSNTIYHRILLFTISILLAGSLPLLTGCGKQKAGDSSHAAGKPAIASTGVKAINRSNANMYGRISIDAKELSPLGNTADPGYQEKMKRVEEVAGLKEEDIKAFTFCGHIDDFSMADISAITDEKKLPVNIAVSLAKAVTFAQMKQVMQILNEDTDPDATYEDIQVEGKNVLKLSPSDDPGNPRFATLANDGTTVYIAMTQAEIITTIQHEHRGETETLPAELDAVYQQLTDGVPIRLAMLMPDSARAKITQQYEEIKAEGGLAAAMMGGMYKPFTNMQSIAITGNIDPQTNFNLQVIGDLASEEAATKGVAAMTMITGLIQGLMPVEEGGEPGINFGEDLKTSMEGKYLKLEMVLPGDTLN
jgi:hypothetical protein